MTANRWALLALAGCVAVSAAGWTAIHIIERDIRKMAEAKWD